MLSRDFIRETILLASRRKRKRRSVRRVLANLGGYTEKLLAMLKTNSFTPSKPKSSRCTTAAAASGARSRSCRSFRTAACTGYACALCSRCLCAACTIGHAPAFPDAAAQERSSKSQRWCSSTRGTANTPHNATCASSTTAFRRTACARRWNAGSRTDGFSTL